jgi:hypothetical protein
MTEEADMEFEQQLVVALRASAERVQPPVEDLVHASYRRGVHLRQRRSRSVLAVGAGLAVAAVMVGAAVGFRPQSGAPVGAPAQSSVSPAACSTVVRTDVLPQWAWTGFSDPKAGGIPYVLGDGGDMVAVLFGQPLSAPEAKDHFNKILWVSRQSYSPGALQIQATRIGSTVTVNRTIATGPGPSYLLLPTPGCWHLSLTWGGGTQHDTMDLPYVAPAG